MSDLNSDSIGEEIELLVQSQIQGQIDGQQNEIKIMEASSSQNLFSSGSFPNSVIFGPGIDGDVVIDDDKSQLSRDMFYNTLTIKPSGRLFNNGYRIFVRDVLNNRGIIHANGQNAVEDEPGLNLTHGTLGAGGDGGKSTVGGLLPSPSPSPSHATIVLPNPVPFRSMVSPSFVSAPTNPTPRGSPGASVVHAVGGSGGKGGTSVTSHYKPGAGGSSLGASDALAAIYTIPTALSLRTLDNDKIQGGAGGGSGSPGLTFLRGGGGGAGGNVLLVVANRIHPSSISIGRFQARGGRGGNAPDNTTGSGGGGGGGLINIISSAPISVLNNLRLNVQGGQPGFTPTLTNRGQPGNPGFTNISGHFSSNIKF